MENTVQRKKRGRKPLPASEKKVRYLIWCAKRAQHSQELRAKKLAKRFGVSEETLEVWMSLFNFFSLKKDQREAMRRTLEISL